MDKKVGTPVDGATVGTLVDGPAVDVPVDDVEDGYRYGLLDRNEDC